MEVYKVYLDILKKSSSSLPSRLSDVIRHYLTIFDLILVSFALFCLICLNLRYFALFCFILRYLAIFWLILTLFDLIRFDFDLI